ncbi:myeloid differentiation primary response protein MyD88-like [Saccostrea echinata]|uniref:myeloid differentiation primary response protein MyD88-like n=1 Tax=Saccostrea echinata TaxID=191078 RepID=UPI002A816DF3|nr:myeloid differentiation primary response protein MyD88-like [Saccostrea echinata]
MMKADFDAFLICSPDGEDRKFGDQLVDKMQDSPYNLKICVPWRDTDGCWYNARDCIKERCRRCIVILSSNFYKSEEAVSQLEFAYSLSPGFKERQILPICLNKCEVPSYLQQISKVEFYNMNARKWFWERLYLSLTTSHGDKVPENHTKNLPDVVKSANV